MALAGGQREDAPRPLLQTEGRTVEAVPATGGSPFRTRNVQVYFYLTTSILVIWSFSFGATFDAYLLELSRHRGDQHPNAFVGSVESVRGLVALTLAVPLGILSDNMNRRALMRLASLWGTSGVFLLALGIALDSVWTIYAGVVLAAILMQVFMACGQALLADSVPKSSLTDVMAWQGSLFLIGYSVGPAAQIFLIVFVGDVWTLPDLHVFLCTGFALWPLVLPGFFLFEPTLTEQLLLDPGAAGLSRQASGRSASGRGVSGSTQDSWTEAKVLGIRKKWLVPALVELSEFITAIGAGMTVKFFPLFFKEDYHFSPIAICTLGTCYTISIAGFVQLCRKLSSKSGRAQASFTWNVCGTICLFVLYVSEPLPLVVAMYIVRGAFMNANGPINQAIVMECVDSKYRGSWSAVQSISRFSWSGSAIFGGWLADSHDGDYRYTFFITGIIYVISTLIYFPLIFLVPSRTEPEQRVSEGVGGAGAANENKDSMISLQAQPEGGQPEARLGG